MINKFTSGKWTAIESQGWYVGSDCPNGGAVICEISEYNESEDELEENAKLIAAAKEMFLTLKMIGADKSTRLSFGTWTMLKKSLEKVGCHLEHG